LKRLGTHQFQTLVGFSNSLSKRSSSKTSFLLLHHRVWHLLKGETVLLKFTLSR